MTGDIDRMISHMTGTGDGWPDQPDPLVERFGPRWQVQVEGDPCGSPAERDRWLAQRRHWLGASEVASVYGHGYDDCWTMCHAKLTGENKPSTGRMEVGNMFEPALLDRAAKELGFPLIKPRNVYGIGRLGANLDGWNGLHKVVVDAKFTARLVAVETCTDFLHQLNAQAAATGATRAYIATVDATREFQLVEFPVATELMVAAVEAAGYVMAHVDLGVHAEPLAGPVVPQPVQKATAEVDPETFQAWQQAKAMFDTAKPELGRLRDLIGNQAALTGAEILTIDGQAVARINTRTAKNGKPYWFLNDLTKNGAA